MVSKKTPCLEGKVEKWYEEGKKLREVEEAKIPFTPPRKSSFMARVVLVGGLGLLMIAGLVGYCSHGCYQLAQQKVRGYEYLPETKVVKISRKVKTRYIVNNTQQYMEISSFVIPSDYKEAFNTGVYINKGDVINAYSDYGFYIWVSNTFGLPVKEITIGGIGME